MSLTAEIFGRDSLIYKGAALGTFFLSDKLIDMMNPEGQPGPRLSDLSVQTSTYGAPIPRLYGTIAVMGNLIWLENNKLKETVRKNKSRSGGKGGGGGGSSEPTTTYSYSATFHIALCEGPIAGIRRIWCADKLLYNAGSDDLETIIASNKAANGWRLYLGSDDQLPDSRYEANVGVGNASAHRGLAYIAFYDFQLADYSNTLQGAQFKVECVSVLDETDIDKISYYRDIGSLVGSFVGNPLTPNLSSYYSIDNGLSFDLFRRDLQGRITYQQVPRNEAVWGALGYSTSYVLFYVASGSLDLISSCYWSGTSGVIGGSPPCFIIAINGEFQNKVITITYDNLIVAERSGVLVFSFTSAPGFPALSGQRYLGIVKDEDGVLTIASHFAASSSDTFCTSISGGVITVGFSINDTDVSGFMSVNEYDSGSTLIRSGSIPFARTAGMAPAVVSTTNSHCYQSSDGSVWISVGQVSADGYALYFHISVSEMKMVGVHEFYGSPNGSSFSPNAITLRDGLLVGATIYEDGVISIYGSAVNVVSPGAVHLSDVIHGEVGLSGLIDAADIDVSMLESQVRGYRISGGSIRSSAEPLQIAFPFDVRQKGYKINFLPRGGDPVAVIPFSDITISNGGRSSEVFLQSREMDTQLAAKTVIKYLDSDREYAISEQSSSRINTDAVNQVELETPLVLSADEAAGAAEVLNFLPWLERTDAKFNLPPIYQSLEPGDVITIVAPDANYEVRLTEINESPDGILECNGRPNRAALYTSLATGGEGVPPSGVIGLVGESLFLPLDIPVIDETLQNDVGFVGVMTGDTDSWPGGLLVRSNDEGQTWTDLQGFSGKATIGTARSSLPASTCTLIDQRTLTVDMISGEPESVTRDQMLSGVNYAAYGLDGRWEVVRFQNAALQADGSYLISGFVRGERGTEWATGLHAAGDYFVLLDDPDNIFIGSPVESIGLSRLYRGVTSGASVDSASDVPFTYRGVNLECLSPVYASGVRDGSSNFTGTFTRRSRFSSSWWVTGVAAPVGEASEAYEIDVMDGSTVARTITASTPSFAYSAADQSTDFGSAQASITFRIYQLSATVGRGYPLEVTL